MFTRPSTRRGRAGVAAATVALTSLAVVASTAGGSAAQEAAPVPSPVTPAKSRSPWTTLSSGPGVSLIHAPRVVRWGKQLLVVWPQDTTDNSTAIKSRVLDAAGKPASPESTVVTWKAVSNDPTPFLLGGVPTIAFGGLRTLDSTDPYTGPMAYAQAGDAKSWALGAGSLTHVGAYGDYGMGAVDDGTGQPVVALAASSTDHVTVHHGIDAAVPAAQPDQVTAPTDEAQQVNLVKDPLTNKAYALWYASRTDAQEGVHAAQVWPTVETPSAPAPYSTVAYGGARESVNPGQNVAAAGRIGGGVWAAYASGYPSPRNLVLWDVMTGRTLALKRPGTSTSSIQYVGLSAAPGGRLWVYWVEGGTLLATRTNPAVTRFGAVRSVIGPIDPGSKSAQSITRTAGDGNLGPLDAVINQSLTGSPESQISTTRIVEALQVSVRTRGITALRGGTLVVTVSDAGVPVVGASVKVGRVTLRTSAKGTATFVIAKGSAKGRHPVTARASGYAAGSARYLVR